MQVKLINSLPEDEAFVELQRCCGSTAWTKRMVERRPFAGAEDLLAVAEQIWWHLGREDWLEAFSHHPKIGADIDTLRKKFAATANWSAGEQSGVAQASEDTLQALAAGNREYEEKFGYIFIVCATGKSADEMLAILRGRLPHDGSTELRIAAGEQAKITRIRLEKLCQEVQSQPTC